MLQRDVYLNRSAITTMAYFSDVDTLCSLFGQAHRSMIRLGIGFADSPPVAADPALVVINPVRTTPSIIDIVLWMDSLNVDSDSTYDSDTDDNSVDEFEFLSRLYTTLRNRTPPGYKAVVDARGY